MVTFPNHLGGGSLKRVYTVSATAAGEPDVEVKAPILPQKLWACDAPFALLDLAERAGVRGTVP